MALYSESELQIPKFEDDDVPEYVYKGADPSIHPLIKISWKIERQNEWLIHSRIYDRKMNNLTYEIVAAARNAQSKIKEKLDELEKKFDNVVLVEKTKESMLKKYGPGAGAGAGIVIAAQFIEPIKDLVKKIFS